MIQFICGCIAKIDLPLTEEVFRTYDSVVIDSEGFMVCLTHHERRKGWRSLPVQNGKLVWRMAGWSPLEIERWLYWGERPARIMHRWEFNHDDFRDNRDPALIGAEILAKKNGNEAPTMIIWPERKGD